MIFVDEIDAVRSLPFSTDEFFAAIRACYNRRPEEPEFGRLTFCLLGVATPSDLIQDTRTTPFNIGERIELNDFTEAEAAPLAQGLVRTSPPTPPLQGEGRLPLPSFVGKGVGGLGPPQALLQRVLYWTGGHPYLTQRLCQAVAEEKAVTSPADVDRLCEALFLSHGARERDDNLLFVRERLLKSEANLAGLLDLYGQVRLGKRVPDDQGNPVVSLLRLSGITRVVDGYLRVRNRIYERVFDPEWVRANMPDTELRRQQAAYRKGVLSTMATVMVALLVASTLYISYVQLTVRRGMLESSVRELRALAQIMGTNCTAALTFDDSRAARETLAALGAMPRIVSAAIYRPDGRLFAHYRRGGVTGAAIPMRPGSDGLHFESDRVLVFQRIMGPRPDPRMCPCRCGTIYLQLDTTQLFLRLEGYMGLLAGILLASALVALPLSLRLQRVGSSWGGPPLS